MSDPSTTGYVDIHAHLLPGIDDGPADLAGSLEMARAAAEVGIATVVATPHLRLDFPDVHVNELADRCRAVQQAIDSYGIQLQVICGAEISLSWALEADYERLTLASVGQQGTDLLIETPDDVSGIEQLLFSLRVKCFRIILAHPERSRHFQRHPERVKALSDQGVILEVNAEALLLPRRSPRRKLAERLCTSGCVAVLASDGHRAKPPRRIGVLAAGAQAAIKLVGVERARWMTSTAPASIVAGKPLPPAPDVQRRLRARRLGRARTSW